MLVLITLAFAAGLGAQEQHPAVADHASREQIMKLLEVSKSRATVDKMMEIMRGQLVGMFHGTWKREASGLAEAKQAELEKSMAAFLDKAMASMPLDRMEGAMALAYQRHSRARRSRP